MKRKFLSLTLIVLTGLIMMACGGKEEANTPEAKRAELKELKKQQIALSKKIKDLEAEVGKLDTSQVAKTVPIVMESVKASTFKHYVNIQGQVEVDNNVLVSPEVAGILTKIYVKEGQNVKKGQTLAKVDDAIMRSSLAEIQTQLDLANIMHDKQKRLWDKEIGTEVQYLQAKNAKESLERRMATLEEQISRTNIKSPIWGEVEEILPKTGEMVSPGFPAFRVVNGSALTLKAQLSESYVPYIHRGDKVTVAFPTIDKTLEASVSRVGQQVDPKSRTFTVEVKLPKNPDVKANMFGELLINDRVTENAIQVPQRVLQKAEKGNYVFVAEKKPSGEWAAALKVVEIGLTYEGQVEIKSGLSAEDQLITSGYKGLSDGQLISPTGPVATK